MTDEQNHDKVLQAVKDYNASLFESNATTTYKEHHGQLSGFMDGVKEVLNNPEKYGLTPVPKDGVISDLCQCGFVLIRRDQNTQIAYCFECGKPVDE